MKLTIATALSSALLVAIPACSSDSPDSPAGGGTGTGGSLPSGGSAGSTTTAGSAGLPPVGGQPAVGGTGALGGSGGQSASGSPATGGSAGAASGGSGGAASGGSGGGGGFWGPTGPKKQWTCPAGPFPAQQQGAQTDICEDLNYRFGYNEGPTWIASQNAFFFSNFIQGSNEGGDIIKYTLGGACEIWLQDVGCNGLGVSPSGNLLAACHGPRSVMEYNVTDKTPRVVATKVGDKLLDSPNDLIARSDGNVYFSNTTYELGPRPPGLGFGLVRIDPMGVTSLIEGGGLNGVALSPDETKLHVVQKGTWTLDASGLPGQKGGPSPGGDGIAVDCAGNISNNGTNSAFGGPDGKTLIVVGGGTNAKTIAMTVPGLP